MKRFEIYKRLRIARHVDPDTRQESNREAPFYQVVQVEDIWDRWGVGFSETKVVIDMTEEEWKNLKDVIKWSGL